MVFNCYTLSQQTSMCILKRYVPTPTHKYMYTAHTQTYIPYQLSLSPFTPLLWFISCIHVTVGHQELWHLYSLDKTGLDLSLVTTHNNTIHYCTIHSMRVKASLGCQLRSTIGWTTHTHKQRYTSSVNSKCYTYQSQTRCHQHTGPQSMLALPLHAAHQINTC